MLCIRRIPRWRNGENCGFVVFFLNVEVQPRLAAGFGAGNCVVVALMQLGACLSNRMIFASFREIHSTVVISAPSDPWSCLSGSSHFRLHSTHSNLTHLQILIQLTDNRHSNWIFAHLRIKPCSVHLCWNTKIPSAIEALQRLVHARLLQLSAIRHCRCGRGIHAEIRVILITFAINCRQMSCYNLTIGR